MAVEVFDLASILKIDGGRIREAWEQALKRAREDCYDRPGLKKPREVHLVALLEPDPESDTVNVSFKVKDQLPPRHSASYNMKQGRGGLLYNEVSPDDVHQRTLDEVGGPRTVVGGSDAR